jgi:hypothetical protein
MTGTFNARRGSIFESIVVEFDLYRSRRRIRNRTDFWGTLTEVGPLMRRSVVEPIGLGTVGAVNDSGGTWVLNSRNCLLILYHDESKTAESTSERIPTGLMVCGRTLCFTLWPADPRKIYICIVLGAPGKSIMNST